MTLNKFYLFNVGAGFVLTALAGFFAPEQLTKESGIVLTSVSSINEIRSLYGGVHMALGIFIVWSAIKNIHILTSFFICTLFPGGYAVGRLISIAFDGMPNAAILFFTGLEIVIAVAGVILMRRSGLASLENKAA